MKKILTYTSCLILPFLGLAPNATAQTQVWWDNNGTSAASNGTWDTTSLDWAPSSTLTASTFAFTNGNFAIFAGGTTTIPSLTITVPGPVTCEGIGDATTDVGVASGAPVTALTFSGPGPITLPSGTWSIECGVSANNIAINTPITGSGGIAQHNSGALELLGTNNYSGGTQATGGQVLYYNNNNSFGTGPISTSGGSTSFLSTSTNLVTLPNAFNINSGTIVVNFGQGNVTSSGAWTLGVTPQLKNNAGNTTLTVSGPISGAFGMDMLCDNTGAQITLSGANTYTGVSSIGLNGVGATTIVNVSSINSVSTPAQQTSSSLGVPSSVANGTIAMGYTTIAGQMNYAGSGETSDRVINLAGTTGGAIIEMDGTGPLVLTSAFTATGAGSKTLTLQGSSTAANTIAGAIVNNSSANKTSLTKAQAGTWVLSGVNTFTGNTTISGGTLEIGGAGSLGSGSYAGTIANAGAFIYASSASQTLSGVISGVGNLAKTGTGTLIISGNANTFTYGGGANPAVIINGGIVQTGGDNTAVNHAANFGNTPASLQPNNIVLNGGTLQGNNPNFAFMPNRGITLTANSGLSAIISGNGPIPDQGEMGIQGPITDNGAGYGITITGQTNLTTGLLSGVYLEGTNTYTGPTVVQSGILSLFGNGSINNSSSLGIASGAVFDVSSDTNFGNVWSLNQPLIANGSGLGLPGLNTVAPTPAAVLVGVSGGEVILGAQPLMLTITPTNFTGDSTQPALYVSQSTVVLNGNIVYVTNNASAPLTAGTYTLIQQASGSMNVSGAPTLGAGLVFGNGIDPNTTATLMVSGGALNLVVTQTNVHYLNPSFWNLTPAPGFVYGSATSIFLSGTCSNLAGGVASPGDTITVTAGSFGTQTATIGTNGSFTINYAVPAFAAAGNYPITYSYNGSLSFAQDTSTTLQISQALLSVTASDPSRNYNGGTLASVTLTPAPLNGDAVTISSSASPGGATNFASANVGTGIAVTITGLKLTGAAAGNYYLPSPYTLSGNITTPNFTWNGLDSVTNNNFQWGDQFNWVGNVAPDLVGDSLDFGGTTGLVPVVQANYTNWSLTFDSTAGSFVITNLGGATGIAIGAGGITNNSTNTETVAVPVSALTSSSSLWFVANGGSLLMSSNVSDAGGGITLGGEGFLSLAGSNNAVTGPFTNLSGTLAITGGAKVGNGTYAGNINNNGTFVFNSTSNHTFSGVISGSGTLIDAGTGTLTLSGTSTYTGQTIVSNSSLVISKDSNLGTPPASPVANQLVLNNFINGGANNYGLRDTGGNFTLNANRGIYLGPLGGSINVQNGFTLTVAGTISGPGSFYATPNDSAGFGTIILTANNTYQGGTFIGAGVLELGVSGTLPTGTPLTINQAASTVAATLNMNGMSQTVGPLQSAQFGGTGTLLPTIDLTGALTVLETNGTTTFSGAMTGAGGSLTIAVPNGGVPGTLVLTGTNTYSGATAINAGTLALSTKGSISNSASISVAAGATLDVSALTSSTYNLSASTSLSASGTGTVPGSTAAAINGAVSGTVNLGAQAISLTYTPASTNGDASHPALYISQGTLQLNNNTITINNASAQPLGAGTYTIIQQATGSISGTPSAVATVTGSGLAAGTTASISVSGGSVNLVVAPAIPPTPVINSFSIVNGQLVLSGTNGSDNGTFIVLTSTNAALPLNQWTPLSTNTFGGSGTFNVTNNISGNQMFFRIQIPY